MSTFSDINTHVANDLGFVTRMGTTLTSLGSTITQPLPASKTLADKFEFTQERLHVIAPRNALPVINSNGSYISDRGTIAKMRLLTPLKDSSKNRSKAFADMDLSPDFASLTSGTFTSSFLQTSLFPTKKRSRLTRSSGTMRLCITLVEILQAYSLVASYSTLSQ